MKHTKKYLFPINGDNYNRVGTKYLLKLTWVTLTNHDVDSTQRFKFLFNFIEFISVFI